jgi:abscisic-aldehyde oxidase
LDNYGSAAIFTVDEVKQKHDQLDHVKVPTLLSLSKHVFEVTKEYHPVGEPVKKSGAALQASGLYLLSLCSCASKHFKFVKLFVLV